MPFDTTGLAVDPRNVRDLRVLHEARELIAIAWCRGALSLQAKFNPARAQNDDRGDDAVAYCAIGAIDFVIRKGRNRRLELAAKHADVDMEAADFAARRLYPAIEPMFSRSDGSFNSGLSDRMARISRFNDTKTKHDVLAMYDRAIAHMQSEN